jgi:23S rRNA pseudouridine2605 synthase
MGERAEPHITGVGLLVMDQNAIRLSKFLANAGVASRRESDEIIKSGRVSVNKIAVVDPFHRVRPATDVVTVDNVQIEHHIKLKYWALYKPVGYLSDLKDKRNRRLARTLVDSNERLFPVGRLDYQSEGLMLFTNDGRFAQRVMHPRYETEKEYLVKLKGKLDQAELQKTMQGLLIENVRYVFDLITLACIEREDGWYRITVHEGKNRMIRKVAEALSHPVLRLRRIRIGPVKLGSLKPGESRQITQKEIAFFIID